MSWAIADASDIDDASIEPVVYDAQLVSPLLSARRIPQSLQAPIAFDAIQPAIDAVLRGSTPDSCLIVSVEGRILGQQNPAVGLVPASNEKLVTTYVALQVLGAEARFTTKVETPTPPVAGVIDGNLFLIGGGDPFLSTDDWWAQYDDTNGRAHTRLEALADAVVAAGVTQVTGNVVGDESYFDQIRTGEWAQRLIDSNQSGPLTALAVNQGYAQWPAVYEGSFRPRVAASDPALHATQVFAALLADRGVTVGGTSVGIAPVGSTSIATIESPPVLDLITHVNSYSDNYGAEILLKHLGRQASGVGSTAAGASAVTAFLQQNGFPMTGVSIVDGSGLAETQTLTCGLLSAVLAAAGPDSAFAESLSIGGERGSLVNRHVGTPADGNVFAKTGTLNDVTALSGFVDSVVDDGTSVIFAYIVNGELAGQDQTIRALQEPFVEQLAEYPQAPSTEDLDPLPSLALD